MTSVFLLLSFDGRGGRREELQGLQGRFFTDRAIAAYREFVDDGFLITAFMTSSPEKILPKGILWQKLLLS
jgi:hypothetical protein